MSAARFLPTIDRMIDELKALREDVVREQESAEPDPIYLTPDEYAQRSDVSVETVRRWLKAGLPHIRRGHVVRIKVAEADAWTPSDEVLRSARLAAHKGSR
jgi:excisionase family DNA binding protein